MATYSLVAIWIFCSLAIVVMAIRLILGRICKQKFDAGDQLTVAAIVFPLARIAFTHMIIIWKTNNVSNDFRAMHHFTSLEIYHRGMGGKFTLVARSLYILLLWTQKCVLLVFYRKLVYDMPWGKSTLICYLALFIATFCGSMIFTFVECHPFDKYWQFLPDPGQCVRALDQLFVVGILNIFTDLMLIALPIPVLLQVHLSISKKVRLGFLFCIGLVIIVVTVVRIPWTLNVPASETTRITWTTGEFLAATFVANAPTLYLFRKRFERRKSQQFNHVRSPRRAQEVSLSGYDSTVKTQTQGVDREAVGEGTNSTGETLVG